MEIVRSIVDLRAGVGAWRQAGVKVGLTTTMGALHAGHLSLLDRARAGGAERIVATIFVNPTQFGPGEDFEAYPRDEARDAAMLKEAGCDLLFVPPVDEVYPPGFATEVRVKGLTDVLCGAARPGHFDGVALVVSKLLNQAQADLAVFGEKDWQQLAIIRRMARDLDIPVTILGAPILREPDGLAMSSRNRYLTDHQRNVAAGLHAGLQDVAADLREGRAAEAALRHVADKLVEEGFSSVDYIEARDGATLAPLKGEAAAAPELRVFAAATLGRARLIDNLPVWPDGVGGGADQGARPL